MNYSIRPATFTRRELLYRAGAGLGPLALCALMAGKSKAENRNPLAIRPPHHPPRAQRVIFMFMNGGPSQLDLFDYKPQLQRDGGKEGKKGGQLLPSPWTFQRHGESGIWMSELLPHLSTVADELCVIRSMQTESSAHPLAIPLLHTGSFQFRRPSIGSWILYGLGTENEELPGFISIKPTRTFGGPSNYGSAFLPSAFQGTRIGFEGTSIEEAGIGNLNNSRLSPGMQRQQLEFIQSMNRRLLSSAAEMQTQGVIDALQLSERMQDCLPQVMDLSGETKETLDRYGIDQDKTNDFGRQCLLARRFAEAGVRFVEIAESGWDHHSELTAGLAKRAYKIDKPIVALLSDLQERGLLEDTLLVWCGEFGRQPEAQVLEGKMKDGRDHNADGYTVWLAGGGVRRGLVYGRTDEYGYEAVEDSVQLHDLHATILHLLGLDHERLTYRYGGRDFRLTDVYGNVVHDIMA